MTKLENDYTDKLQILYEMVRSQHTAGVENWATFDVEGLKRKVDI